MVANSENTDRKYQVVVLILDNGKEYSFVGKAIDSKVDIIIKDIKISKPKELPPDIHFEVME